MNMMMLDRHLSEPRHPAYPVIPSTSDGFCRLGRLPPVFPQTLLETPHPMLQMSHLKLFLEKQTSYIGHLS